MLVRSGKRESLGEEECFYCLDIRIVTESLLMTVFECAVVSSRQQQLNLKGKTSSHTGIQNELTCNKSSPLVRADFLSSLCEGDLPGDARSFVLALTINVINIHSFIPSIMYNIRTQQTVKQERNQMVLNAIKSHIKNTKHGMKFAT